MLIVPSPRLVVVDRTIPAGKVFENLGRRIYVDPRYLNDMPVGKGDKVEVRFFEAPATILNRKGVPIPNRLLEEYERRGLTLDPRAHAMANEVSGMTTSREDDMSANASFFMSKTGECVYVVFGRADAWPVVWVKPRVIPCTTFVSCLRACLCRTRGGGAPNFAIKAPSCSRGVFFLVRQNCHLIKANKCGIIFKLC